MGKISTFTLQKLEKNNSKHEFKVALVENGDSIVKLHNNCCLQPSCKTKE